MLLCRHKGVCSYPIDCWECDEREDNKMDLQKLYQTNEAFKDYVDKYANQRKETIEQVLELQIVKEYALFLIKNI